MSYFVQTWENVRPDIKISISSKSGHSTFVLSSTDMFAAFVVVPIGLITSHSHKDSVNCWISYVWQVAAPCTVVRGEDWYAWHLLLSNDFHRALFPLLFVLRSIITSRYFRYRFMAHLHRIVGCGRQVRLWSCETRVGPAYITPTPRHFGTFRDRAVSMSYGTTGHSARDRQNSYCTVSTRLFDAFSPFPRVDNDVFSARP